MPIKESVQKQLDMPGYSEKVPEAVQKQTAEKMKATIAEIATVEQAITDFKAMSG